MYARNITYCNDKSVFLFGPRSVGKTSWIRAEFKDSLYFDLLDSSVYIPLLASPTRLGDQIPVGFNGWVVLDRLHQLKGTRKGFFAVDVSGNWRLVFRFSGTDVIDVDYVDYH